MLRTLVRYWDSLMFCAIMAFTLTAHVLKRDGVPKRCPCDAKECVIPCSTCFGHCIPKCECNPAEHATAGD